MRDNSNLHKIRIFFIPSISLQPTAFKRSSVKVWLLPALWRAWWNCGPSGRTICLLIIVLEKDLGYQSGNLAAHHRGRFKMFLCQTLFRGRGIVADFHYSTFGSGEESERHLSNLLRLLWVAARDPKRPNQNS